MSTATKEAAEVYYPQWLDTRIAHMVDAVDAVRWMCQREDTFGTVASEHTGEREPTNGARQVWGAEQVLKDVHERLTAIRVDPAEYADELDGFVGELWEASYRLNAASATLHEHDHHGENALHVLSILDALADGLNALGTLTDHRQGREAKGGES